MPDTTPSPAPPPPTDGAPLSIETYARDHIRAGYERASADGTLPFAEFWAQLLAQRSPALPAPGADEQGDDVIDRLTPEELERWGVAQARMMTALGLQRRAAILKQRAEAELRTLYFDFGDRAGVGDEVVPSAVDPAAGVMRRVADVQGAPAPAPARDARG